MYRALIGSFVRNKKLVTTYAKAKVVGPMLEKLITRARKNSLSDRRFVYKFVGNDRKMSDEIIRLSKLIVSKNGGLLSYTNLPARKGDNAPMARVEFAVKIEDKKPTDKEKTALDVSKEGGKGKDVKNKPSIASIVKKLNSKKKSK
jgi:large subunit ribosomal protein L17